MDFQCFIVEETHDEMPTTMNSICDVARLEKKVK
jgi:hypothetical protein